MRPPWARHRRPLVLPGPPSQASSTDPVCLVHIVRKVNGLSWLQGFADALRAHPPGTDHELVLAMKGFSSPGQARPYLDEVADLAPEALFFEDRGFDLGTYFAVARRLRRHRYCFVKCQCRPLVDGWLAKLDAALDRPGVGQAGSTGSWASLHSWLMYSTGLPSAYRSLLPPRQAVREVIAAMQVEQGVIEQPSAAHSIRMRLRTLPNVPEELLGFRPFPAPHMRLTAFVITHAALSELRLFEIHAKGDTLALESGRQSLTAQLQRMGCTSLVVDRAGSVYEPEQWHRSRTFMQGDQEGLLVAENHTLCYSEGDLARRRFLSSSAWGSFADPAAPREDSLDAALRAA
ncbi:MAG: hypothetical protein ABSB69_06115 [Solirubrobacteraceae bacterium]